MMAALIRCPQSRLAPCNRTAASSGASSVTAENATNRHGIVFLPCALRFSELGGSAIRSPFTWPASAVTTLPRSRGLAPPGCKSCNATRQSSRLTAGRAKVRVSSALDEQTPYDLVIVALLAHQMDAVLPTLKRSAARCIQFMFNTFDPERLKEAIGVERCAFGMPFVQATLDADGRLKATIGAAAQTIIMSRQRWVDVFRAAGVPAALERDMSLWLRCHVLLCVAFESVSVAGEQRGGGASWAEAFVLARGIHASYLLIRRLGYRVYPDAHRLIAISPSWALAAMLWFMSRVPSFRELLATGKTECCALVDVMVAVAQREKPPFDVADLQAMKPF